jgi:hypothetical protein
MDSLQDCTACVEPLAVLSRFRLDFHACLTARGDELFELADAVLCADGPVRTLAGLSLAPEPLTMFVTATNVKYTAPITSTSCLTRRPPGTSSAW